MTTKQILGAISGATLALAVASCSDTDPVGVSSHNTIVASISEPTESRTAVDDSNLANGSVSLLWTDGDVIGAFDANGSNHTQYVKTSTGADAEGAFSAANAVSGFAPKYAYYPYDANAGSSASSLSGTVDANQKVGTGNVPCDYKVGTFVSETDGVSKFQFDHIFSLVRVDLDAAGTILANEALEYVKFTAQTDVAGSFTFSAVDGSVGNTITDGSKSITLTWPDGTTLASELKEYFSVIPTVQAGDNLAFEVKTANYTFAFSADSKVAFAKGALYNFPLNLLDVAQKYAVTVTDAAGNPVDLTTGESTNPTPDPDPTTITGTFTCATLNVDGLPQQVTVAFIPVTINGNGPGSDGTTKLSQTIAAAGWDFFAASEDFEYDTQLKSALGDYTSGTYRAPGKWTSASSRNPLDTDGLNFFCKKDGFSFANETIVEYTDKEGGLTSGANECVKKGFRHYEVTVGEGAVIDVYITHMNTYSGDTNDDSNAYWKAQMSQLRQLRDYVIEKAKANNRPAIIMGDTNLRYTRHSIEEQFIDYITGQGLTVNDPWVMFHRPGYPTFGGKSLMINSKFVNEDEEYNTTADICCCDNNKGEVVDKIFYINVPGAALQLKATSYKNDDSAGFVKKTTEHDITGATCEDANYNLTENAKEFTLTKKWGLADHFPAVATFEWTLTKSN